MVVLWPPHAPIQTQHTQAFRHTQINMPRPLTLGNPTLALGQLFQIFFLRQKESSTTSLMTVVSGELSVVVGRSFNTNTCA